MKTILFFLSALLLQQNAFAKNGEIPDEADYVVPTSKELVAHSRFKIKIEAPYQGATTNEISYTFPPELTGIVNHVVKFKRVGKTNDWESPEMTASCTESYELFSCNVYLVKEPAQPVVEEQQVIKNNFMKFAAHGCGANKFVALNQFQPELAASFIDKAKVEAFLKGAGFTGAEFDSKMAVARAFACSEPAGILSYEFK